MLQVDGDDGNGYYGTGYEINVKKPIDERKTINRERKPTVIEILPPNNNLEKTSLPFISVPNKYSSPPLSTPIKCLSQGINPKNLYFSPLANNFK